MLIEFSVGNFRSFKEIVTLSMVAAKLTSKDKALDENNVFETPGAPPLLTSATIYGANASGKSNLVAAVRFMRRFVLSSQRETKATGGISVDPFLLRTGSAEEPSHFETVFVIDGVRYRYGFNVTTERVSSEWLYSVSTSREARLFERREDGIKLGESFRGEGKELIELTRPNALFLSVVAQFNGPTSQKVVNWFRKMRIVSAPEDSRPDMRFRTLRGYVNDGLQDDIVRLITRLDLGIDDIRVEKVLLTQDSVPDNMPEEVRRFVRDLIDDPRGEAFTIKTVHKAYDAEGQEVGTVLFDLDRRESEGTKKLFSLAGTLLGALRDGRLLIVDELDARLHPLMTREIISLFNSKQTNPQHAQLIFTTQDTNLLDNRLLRRDQIWFTEKDRQGATQLYSLAEFKVRNDEAFERNYIQGRYGAVPFLGDLRQTMEAG